VRLPSVSSSPSRPWFPSEDKHEGFTSTSHACTTLQLPLTLLLCIMQVVPLSVTAAAAGRRDMVLISQKPARQQLDGKRPVTVDDAIRMTKIGAPAYYRGATSYGRVAQFSPDGKQFTVVLRKGDLDKNTNDYTLLLWRTEQAVHSSPPQVLLTMSCSSNLEAIADVTWLPDNETLLFLGKQNALPRQLYSLNTRTHIVKRLTNHPTNLISYSASRAGDTIAYLAEQPFESIWDNQSLRHAVVVAKQWIPDLITGRKGYDYRGAEGELFVLDSRGTHRLHALGAIHQLLSAPHLSPNGRYIVIPTEVADIPEDWRRYQDAYLQASIRATASAPVSDLLRYELVDTVTKNSRVLLDSPVQSGQVIWLPDSRSVVLSEVYLPLGKGGSDRDNDREAHTFTVELGVADSKIATISRDVTAIAGWWEDDTHRLAFETPDAKSTSRIYFLKVKGGWKKDANLNVDIGRAEVILEEEMNSPPKIYIRDPSTGHNELLLDLNPQFAQLRFTKVEEVKWKRSDGADAVGGLYYPLGYVSGRRYPLVIQMHGWNPHRFWIDGPSTTAFAAQPLASKDIMVLQADDAPLDLEDQDHEIRAELAIIEGAIRHLDELGLIDRSRIGLVGWSRSSFFVKYALTRSKYRFAAASVSEGEDGGYLQYITNNNWFVDDDSLYGGPPFGKTLDKWVGISPSFNIANVDTPLRITVLNSRLLLLDWEWFEALRRLGKPVEMVMMRDGTHILQQPWQRVVSQQGTVDWFAFWLKGEEDPDPSKAEQYERWRRIREQNGSVLTNRP
jgi:dipeptidyl aminopeptidase/acylaminoacyl peptidase